MTPRRRCSALSAASLTQAPRSLNEVVTCKFSYLTKISAPVSADSGGDGNSGVRSTWPAMVRRAASISASVTIAVTTPCSGGRGFPFGGGASTLWRPKIEAHHDRFWTGTDRHLARRQAARLRSGRQSGAFRGCAVAAAVGLFHRRPHHRRSGHSGRDRHLPVRHRDARPRLDAVLAVVAGFRRLGPGVLRRDHGERGVGYHRDARHGD